MEDLLVLGSKLVEKKAELNRVKKELEELEAKLKEAVEAQKEKDAAEEKKRNYRIIRNDLGRIIFTSGWLDHKYGDWLDWVSKGHLIMLLLIAAFRSFSRKAKSIFSMSIAGKRELATFSDVSPYPATTSSTILTRMSRVVIMN